MDNRALSQVLSEIADLLEIRGDNAFKIRAYRTAAETLATWPQAIVQLDEQALRAIPGIGKDLAARIRELAETGTSSYHQELLQQFPATILDLRKLVLEEVRATKDFDGLLGKWTFDADGDTSLTDMSGLIITGGEFVFEEIIK